MKFKILILIFVLFVTGCGKIDNNIADTSETLPKYETYYNASGDLVIYYPQETEPETTVPIDTSIPTPEELEILRRTMCTVHELDYHSYDTKLLLKVCGNWETFHQWNDCDGFDVTYYDRGCPFSQNIVEFLKHFNVSREMFELYYYENMNESIHNIDIMYSGNDALIDKYYRTKPNEEEMGKQIRYYSLKTNMRLNKKYINGECFPFTSDENIINKYKTLPVNSWTLPEYLFDAKVTKEIFIECVKTGDTSGGYQRYEYNYDAIYAKVAELEERAANGENPTEIKYDAEGNPIFGNTVEETIQYYKNKIIEDRQYYNYKPLYDIPEYNNLG